MNHKTVFMQRTFKIIGLFLTVCLSAPAAQAQVQLPEFSISSIPTLENMSQDSFDYERAFSNIKNPVMADTLRLQYQINLLERLIRRQTEIQRIAESYQGVGIPFRQPAPPETACATLPINILCMAFYPESTKYKDLIEERREEARRDQQREMEAMLREYNITPVQNTNRPQRGNNTSSGTRIMRTDTGQQFTAPVPDPDYIWSDIRCLSGNCSALLESTSDTALRFRIRSGDELPDGSKVTQISANGVNVVKEDEDFRLKPKGLTTVPRMDRGGEVADILRQQFGTVPGTDENSDSADDVDISTANDGAIPPQSLSDTGLPSLPLLGPTGLF